MSELMALIQSGGGAVGGVLAIVAFLLLVALLRTFIRVCPSNQILVITGGTKTVVGGKEYGFRIQKGGWTTVIPFIQSAQGIDLTIIPINVQVDNVNSANGITVGADATACVCIDDSDEILLYSAVQQLLGKSRVQIQEQIQQTMIGNFRAALNKTTPLQAIGMVESAEGVDDEELAESVKHVENIDAEGERALFRQLLLEDCRQDLSTFGVDVVSVSLQRIWDTSNYIANLANKTLSGKRQDVEIEEARLRARAERAESDAKRRMIVAENIANEKILEVEQQVEVFRRKCQADIQRAKLEADSAISKADSESQRSVEEISAELQKLKNSSEVIIDADAARRAAETIAEGQGEAIEIVQHTRNDLLEQRAKLLSDTGDVGKVALFLNRLPTLFETYQTHAANLKVDKLLVMNEDDGFSSVVNRGPAALVDFLRCFEEGFGISIKELMTSVSAQKGS